MDCVVDASGLGRETLACFLMGFETSGLGGVLVTITAFEGLFGLGGVVLLVVAVVVDHGMVLEWLLV